MRAARRCGAPAVAACELAEVVPVVAQLLPDVAALDPQQPVEPRLVVGKPVVRHPRLARQPVRWGIGRGIRVWDSGGKRRGGPARTRNASASRNADRRRVLTAASILAPMAELKPAYLIHGDDDAKIDAWRKRIRARAEREAATPRSS